MTDSSFAKGLLDGLLRIINENGATTLFNGIWAMLAKQIPYTIMKVCDDYLNMHMNFGID